jgi:hypothetical protein
MALQQGSVMKAALFLPAILSAAAHKASESRPIRYGSPISGGRRATDII